MPDSWRYEDDIFAPQAKIRIDFNGPNPFRFYGPTMTILRNILEVGAEDVWERDFRWDNTSDPRSFFVRFYVNVGIDHRTRHLVEIIFEGSQPSDPTKNGKIKILIGGRLRTDYDLRGGWRRLPIYWGFLWLYHKIFYNNVRRGYMRLAQETLYGVAAAYRKLLGMPPVPAPETRK